MGEQVVHATPGQHTKDTARAGLGPAGGMPPPTSTGPRSYQLQEIMMLTRVLMQPPLMRN
jgi:hypothetical protein